MNSGNHEHASNNGSNWLAFSLSNSSLSLFQTSSAAANDGVEEDVAELSMMMGGEGPKLEDYLGASSGSNNNNSVVVGLQTVDNEQRHFHHHHHHQQQQIYEDVLEQRTIAPSFFALQNDGNSVGCGGEKRDQLQIVAVQQPATKKTVETFGQRTSVFRGVTR